MMFQPIKLEVKSQSTELGANAGRCRALGQALQMHEAPLVIQRGQVIISHPQKRLRKLQPLPTSLSLNHPTKC